MQVRAVPDLTLSSDPDTKLSQIPCKNIVAVVSTNTLETTVEHAILHVVDNPASGEAGEQLPIKSAYVQVEGLPATFVNRFQPASGSPWVTLTQREHASRSNIHVVISTGSGTGLAKEWWDQLVAPLLSYNGLSREDYTLHITASESSITELIQNTVLPKANTGVFQDILLLSGDGGIVDTINALSHGEQTKSYVKPRVTLLPAGTGNALANSAVLGNDSTLGLRTMFCGTSKEVPAFRAIFSPGARLQVNEGNEERNLDGASDGVPVAYGAVVCSWGLHATLVADSDTTEYRKFGSERFKMAGKEALFPSDGSPPHAYKGKVSILRPAKDSWESIPRDDHGYILAALVSNLEAGFTISPSSRPLDGKLWLVHFGHVGGQVAMEVMTKAYQGGRHVEDQNVGYDEIEGLKIEFDEEDGRWRRVCIDGKIVRVEKGGWVEIRMGVRGVIDLICREA